MNSTPNPIGERVLCFLVEKGIHGLVCLAPRLTPPRIGTLDGYGGHRRPSDRSTLVSVAWWIKEKSGAKALIENFKRAAVVDSFFPDNEHLPRLRTTIYLCRCWSGTPHKTKTMGTSQWFKPLKIPLEQLSPCASLLLPKLLIGMELQCVLYFDKYGTNILSSKLHETKLS